MNLPQIRRMLTHLKRDDGKIDLGEARRLVSRIKEGGVRAVEYSGLQRIARNTLTARAAHFVDAFIDRQERAR